VTCTSASAKRSHMRWPTLGLSANWQRSIPLAECNRHQMRSYPLHGKRRNLRRRNGCCARGRMSFWRAILKRSVRHCFFLCCGQKHRCYQALFTQWCSVQGKECLKNNRVFSKCSQKWNTVVVGKRYESFWEGNLSYCH